MGNQRVSRRSIAIALALAGSLAGCGPAPTPTPPPAPPPCGGNPTCHFDRRGVAFDYPAFWNAASFRVLTSFTDDLVSLSTAQLVEPCRQLPNGSVCSWYPVESLDFGGLLVTWRARFNPAWTFDPTRGRQLIVGGRRATLEDKAPNEGCAGIGGARQVIVTIPDPEPLNWMEVDACLAGPDSSLAESAVKTMLATVVWKN